jgi:hypothetical protein
VPGRVAVDLGLLGQWCVAHLGEGTGEVRFRRGYLSTVIGVRLETAANWQIYGLSDVANPLARADQWPRLLGFLRN